MKHHSFEKFINHEKNSRKKEAIKQEKRKWKEEKKRKYEERSKRYEIKSKTDPQRSGLETQSKSYNHQSTAQKELTSGKQHNATEIPLNKFISHAGICGRREAAELVKDGKIKVNNTIIYEPGPLG